MWQHRVSLQLALLLLSNFRHCQERCMRNEMVRVKWRQIEANYDQVRPDLVAHHVSNGMHTSCTDDDKGNVSFFSSSL